MSENKKTEDFFERLSEILPNLTAKDLEELAEILKTENEVEPEVAAVAQSDNESSQLNNDPTFDVILTSIGTSPTRVIRMVRDLTPLTLKEIAELILPNLPATIIKGLTLEESELFKVSIESAGGEVKIVPSVA